MANPTETAALHEAWRALKDALGLPRSTDRVTTLEAAIGAVVVARDTAYTQDAELHPGLAPARWTGGVRALVEAMGAAGEPPEVSGGAPTATT